MLVHRLRRWPSIKRISSTSPASRLRLQHSLQTSRNTITTCPLLGAKVATTRHVQSLAYCWPPSK